MKEYLLIGLLALGGLIFLDNLLKTKLFWNKKFWYFQLVILILTIGFDSYLVSKQVVIHNPLWISNFIIVTVPVEDVVFGFNLISLNIILFEYEKKRQR